MPYNNSPQTSVVQAWLRAELSECECVDQGLLIADDELVGALLFLPREWPEDEPVVPESVKPERKKGTEAGKSKLLPVQDIEGLASNGIDLLYCIGSCNSKAGKRRHDREFLLKLHWACARESGKLKPSLKVTGERYDLLEMLLPALKKAGVRMKLGKNKVSPDLNIEGLALDAVRKHLYIGLREPLSAAGNAIVCRVSTKGLFKKQRSELKLKVFELPLTGCGIRGLSWYGADDRLLLIAGGTADHHHVLPAIWSFQSQAAELRRLYRFSAEQLDARDGNPRRYPEGLMVLNDQLICVFDADDGHGGILRMPWPPPVQ